MTCDLSHNHATTQCLPCITGHHCNGTFTMECPRGHTYTGTCLCHHDREEN